MKKVKPVAIAILLQQQKVLLAWRDEQLHQGGCFEFAGGKIEQGETPVDACRREVIEEVGIALEHWTLFDCITHEYDDVIVQLHIYQAVVPQHLNTQLESRWQWVERPQLANYTFPKANQSIIQRLMWQHYIKISEQLVDIHTCPQDSLFYWRFNTQDVHQAVQQLSQLAQQTLDVLSRCIVNIDVWRECPTVLQQQLTTLHLKHQQLMSLQELQREHGVRYLSACHDEVSLQRAVELGVDAVLCSPICATPSHVDVQGIGWHTLQQWVTDYPLPVFALGGVKRQDLPFAQRHGAYGVAGMRFMF